MVALRVEEEPQADVVFRWRKQFREGQLGNGRLPAAGFVPIHVAEDVAPMRALPAPREPGGENVKAAGPAADAKTPGLIEIETWQERVIEVHTRRAAWIALGLARRRSVVSRLTPVSCLAGDHQPDAAAWVRHVAVPARDDVDVRVQNGLARRHAIVKADGETVWVHVAQKLCSDLRNKVPYGSLRLWREIEDAGDVLARDHQGMSLRDGIAVTEREPVLIVQGDAIRRDGAKWAGFQTGRIPLGVQDRFPLVRPTAAVEDTAPLLAVLRSAADPFRDGGHISQQRPLPQWNLGASPTPGGSQ